MIFTENKTPFTVSDVFKAYDIARRQHKGQKDKMGNEYLYHPMRVAENVISYKVLSIGKPNNDYSLYNESEQNFLKVCALLHDVAEDTKMSVEDIITELNFGDSEKSEMVKDVLVLLTHKKGDSYCDYITKILDNDYAMLVKYADLIDNSSLDRMIASEFYLLEDKDKNRINKYISAMRLIMFKMKGHNDNLLNKYKEFIKQFS